MSALRTRSPRPGLSALTAITLFAATVCAGAAACGSTRDYGAVGVYSTDEQDLGRADAGEPDDAPDVTDPGG